MKLRELKKVLNSLSKEELNKELLYNSDSHSISGVATIHKQRFDLYYTGEDDPSTLYSKNKLKEMGHDSEDIEGMDIEIPKGSYVVTF